MTMYSMKLHTMLSQSVLYSAMRMQFIQKKYIWQFLDSSCKDYSRTKVFCVLGIRVTSSRMCTKTAAEKIAVQNALDHVATDLYAKINTRIQQNLGTQLHTMSDAENSNIVMTLLQSKVPNELISKTLAENPVLLKYTQSAWTETTSMLKMNGFQPHQILPIVAGFPGLLDVTNHKTLLHAMTVLRSLGIPDGKQQQIIFRNPLLLLSRNIDLVYKVYSNLLKTFTKSEVLMIMCSSPSVLTDDWQNTKIKINYVYSDMGIRSREITKSRLFGHTFMHLVTRHQFAKRTGFYRMPSKHEIAAKENNVKLVDEMPNPTLHEIVDTTDEKFVQKMGNISLNEYHTFVAMMAEEIDNYSMDTFPSSDDDDYDSDE